MQAASLYNCLSFDGFPPFEYGRSSAEVDASRRQVVQALVVSAVVVLRRQAGGRSAADPDRRLQRRICDTSIAAPRPEIYFNAKT